MSTNITTPMNYLLSIGKWLLTVYIKNVIVLMRYLDGLFKTLFVNVLVFSVLVLFDLIILILGKGFFLTK